MDFRTGKPMRIKRTNQSNLIYFSPDPERVTKFRKKYKKGDRIRAKVIKHLDPKRVIILVGDVRLIALLKKDVSVGEDIILEVKQLTPHIILKHIEEKKGLNIYI